MEFKTQSEDRLHKHQKQMMFYMMQSRDFQHLADAMKLYKPTKPGDFFENRGKAWLCIGQNGSGTLIYSVDLESGNEVAHGPFQKHVDVRFEEEPCHEDVAFGDLEIGECFGTHSLRMKVHDNSSVFLETGKSHRVGDLLRVRRRKVTAYATRR